MSAPVMGLSRGDFETTLGQFQRWSLITRTVGEEKEKLIKDLQIRPLAEEWCLLCVS